MKLLIRNARLLDPGGHTDQPGDVAIADGRIAALGRAPDGFAAERVIDAQGHAVAPGLIDLCARPCGAGAAPHDGLARELAAAAAGGVTTLVCPPETQPLLDEPARVMALLQRAQAAGGPRLLPLGALTQALAGQALSEVRALLDAGCVGLSQGDRPLPQGAVLNRALQYAAGQRASVWLQPCDAALGRGVAASGAVAARLGLAGQPVAAETVALHTAIELARLAGVRVHISRLSAAASLPLLREARAQGLPVTADVSIHQLHLSDVDLGHFDAAMRLSPPLRQGADRAALAQAVGDGLIDAIVSDHTVCSADAKRLPFAQASAGASALELLLGATLKWGEQRGLSLLESLRPITAGPAQVLAATGRMGPNAATLGRLVAGAVADLCLFDAGAVHPVHEGRLVSASATTPFAFQRTGMALPGRVLATLVGGRVVYESQ